MTAANSQFIALMPPKDYAKQGWVDCIRWAASDPHVIEQFCADTGTTMANAPLDDEVLGVKFAKWFNGAIWGEIDGRACNGDEDEGGPV